MQQRVWTLSTVFSVSRFFIVLPIGYCLLSSFPGNRWWAAGFILLGVATDFIDGYLARRFHQVTDFGKIVDPLADKFAVGVVAALLSWLGDLPLWFLATVLLRDVLILAGGSYILRKKSVVVQSNLPGKLAVNAVAFVILLAVLDFPALETTKSIMIWLSVFFMVFSLSVYAKRLFIGRNVAKVNSDTP
jgi:CDP-diacylglycerol--glycerol-3-phosphate 3-phosphatidyltransferase